MKRTEIILVAAMAIPLAGCVLSGKPKPQPAPAPPQPVAPAPPPQPLSIPQTQAEIYPQPIPDGAISPPQAVVTPAPPSTESKPPAGKNTTPKPPPVQGPKTPAEVNATAPTTPEPTRPLIQEIVPPDELKDLKDKAFDLKSKVDVILANTERRGRLNSDQRRVKANVEGFVKQYLQAEKNNDIRAAFENAQKAFTLAQGLPGAK